MSPLRETNPTTQAERARQSTLIYRRTHYSKTSSESRAAWFGRVGVTQSLEAGKSATGSDVFGLPNSPRVIQVHSFEQELERRTASLPFLFSVKLYTACLSGFGGRELGWFCV